MSDDQTVLPLVRALCGKYEKLCELRQRQLSEVAPREELVALAAAFPGALRELDCLSLEELERRSHLLRAAAEGRADVERWMILQIDYHGFMRAVLRIRRLMLSRGGAELQPFEYTPGRDEPAFERFDAQALSIIRRPPRGRLNPWVIAQVARDNAVSEACIEDALWRTQTGARP